MIQKLYVLIYNIIISSAIFIINNNLTCVDTTEIEMIEKCCGEQLIDLFIIIIFTRTNSKNKISKFDMCIIFDNILLIVGGAIDPISLSKFCMRRVSCPDTRVECHVYCVCKVSLMQNN
jgi:hypothetical protein